MSPRLVGQLVYAGSSGSGFGGSTVLTDVVSSGPEPVDGALEPARCTIVIRISADSTGSIRFKVGRAAQPGEAVQDCAPQPACPDRPSPVAGRGSSGEGSSGGGN